MTREFVLKKGDLYKVKYYPHGEFFGIFLLEDSVEHYKDSVHVTSFEFSSSDLGLVDEVSGIDYFDEKITDPKEQAYWLLRFEHLKKNLGK